MIIRYIISMPFIYGMIIPFIILDICAEIYHRICFALYKIPYVDRSKYIFLDRAKLSYLPWWDKLNCAYCGYGNGLLAYVGQIAAETEMYWCAIKQPNHAGAHTFSHQKDFLPFNDKKALMDFANGETEKPGKAKPTAKTSPKKSIAKSDTRRTSAIDLKKK